MCGIAGLAGVRDDAVVRAMTAALVHRGPDDEGYLLEDEVSLGMRRLSIIDLAGSRQPLFSEDRSLATVFNGEIYNYRDLRTLLEKKGHTLATAGDTEVLVHLHEEYGEAGVHLLRGMFAYALWDRSRRRLVLARDRLGIKPLYYAVSGGRLAFASEVRALLAVPWVARDLDPHALALYLGLQYVPGPRTMLRAVRKLEPGHVLVWQDGLITVRRYWDVVFDEGRRGLDEDSAAEEFRELLAEATRLHEIADVPVGVLLSGGIDSASITALLAAGGRRVRTFTVGFDAPGEEGELAHARIVARHCGTDHHEIVLGPSLGDGLPAIVRAQDEPVADPASVATHAVCAFAARSVKVVLTGEGSDELFGGYPRYRWLRAGERARPWTAGLPGLSRLGAALASRDRDNRRLRQLGALLGPASLVDRNLRWIEAADARLRAGLAPALDVSGHLAALLAGQPEDDPVHRLMYLDFKTWLPDDVLAKTDRMSMAVSIEARVPFLDHRVVEWVAALPASLKVRSLGTKALLRHALRGDLPAAVLRRPKRAFLVPLRTWLASSLRDLLVDTLTSPAARTRAFLRQDVVARLVGDQLAGRRDRSRALWTLLVLELWLREVVHAPAAAHD